MLATAQLLEICVFLLYLEVVVIFQLDSIKDLVGLFIQGLGLGYPARSSIFSPVLARSGSNVNA